MKSLLNRLFDHETISIDGEPYLTRWYIWGKNKRTLGEGRHLFLHFFHKSDQGRELHSHPYTGTSLILWGGYLEERMSKVDGLPQYTNPPKVRVFRPGSINRLGLDDFHRTDLLDPRGAWTLFLTGTRVQDWGFLDRNTFEFYPYMSAEERRIGNGPHSRVDLIRDMG